MGFNILSELDGLRIELLLLFFLLLGPILGVGYHVLHPKNFVSLLQVVVFDRDLLLLQGFVTVLYGFEALFLLFLNFALLFVLLHKVAENLVLLQF